jgi:opacity protein-like surface antigen
MGVFKGSLHALFVTGAAVLAAGPAFAADILPPPPPVEAPMAMPAAEFSGWYLRGDVGIGQNREEKFRSTFSPGFVVPGLQHDQGSVSPQLMFGVGVSYQFNSWLRADATVEYNGGARWKQVESYTGACGAALRCVDLYHGRISSAVFLMNGYVDLGTWHNITPYLGIGLGGSNNHVGAITDNGINMGGFGTSPAVSKTSFAWALMAGVAVNIAPNMKLDVGYRYLDKGTIDGGRITCQPNVFCGFETHRMKLASHDLRIGLRYMFGETVYAPPPMPAPLIRKY